MSYETISIKPKVKQLLKELKGELSYSKFIEQSIAKEQKQDTVLEILHSQDKIWKEIGDMDKRVKILERLAQQY